MSNSVKEFIWFEDFSMEYEVLREGTLLNNRYEIKGLIKAGGMGAVYKALDKTFDNVPCAVKEMLSEKACHEDDMQYMIKRFKEEAKLLHNLRHSHLPVVKDYFIENNHYYLVMDYIEGEDLKSKLGEYPGGVPENLVMKWAGEILEVLSFLHSQDPPVIYRDIKPANIMIKKDGTITLIDFGLARKVNPDKYIRMTAVGTPAYAPPELLKGLPEERTDLYSLGATMHHLLTGQMTRQMFTFEPVRSLNPAVSKELEAIVMKSLEVEVEDRYRSAEEMKKELLKLSRATMMVETIKADEETVPFDSLSKIESPESVNPPGKRRAYLKYILILTFLGIASIALVSTGLLLAGLGSGCFVVSWAFNLVESDEQYLRGEDLFDQGRYDEAEACYDKAIELNCYNGDAFCGKAAVLYEKGKYEEALIYIDKSLSIDSENTVAMNNKGWILCKLERHSEAIICFDRVLEIDPDDIDASSGKEEVLKAMMD